MKYLVIAFAVWACVSAAPLEPYAARAALRVEDLVLTPDTLALAYVDQGGPLEATCLNQYGDSIKCKGGLKWTVRDTTKVAPIVTTTQTAWVTARAMGTTWVVVRDPSGRGIDSSKIVVTTDAPAPIPPTPPESIWVALNRDTIEVDSALTDTVRARTYTNAGLTIPSTGRTLNTSSTNAGVVTASPATGVSPLLVTVTGVTPGTSRVVVASPLPGKPDTVVVVVNSVAGPPPDTTSTPPSPPTGKFVATTGSSANPGTLASPWSLSYAFGGPAGLAAGDTVWIREGTYTASQWTISTTAGTSGAKVCYRAYPGERVRIVGLIQANGDNNCLWGIESYQTTPPTAGNGLGINIRGPGYLLVDNFFHDHGQSCIGDWMDNSDGELNGNVVYNCGTHQNLDHGIYFQNQTGTKLLRDNVVFNNIAHGFHGYTSSGQYLNNVTLIGNVGFNSGDIWGGYTSRADYLLGASAIQMSGIVMDSNYAYRNDLEQSGEIGWFSGVGGTTLTFKRNYMAGSRHMGSWTSVDSTGGCGSLPCNTQLTSFPGSGSQVVVRPSTRDHDRGIIIVYNWSLASTVAVNLSSVLAVGQDYKIVHVFDPWSTTGVLSGTYAGGTVSLPMTAVAPPAPLGRGSGYSTAPTPGPRFGVFIIIGERT